MKALTKIISAIFCLIFALTCAGCANKTSVYDFYAFNTFIRVGVTGELDDNQQLEIASILSNLDKAFSVTDQNSLVYKLNALNAQERLETTDEFNTVFNKAKEFNAFSQNKFNVALYPLIQLWQFSPMVSNEYFVLPTNDSVNEIIKNDIINLENFILDNQAIYKTNSKSKLDFGGILKGYACEKIDSLLSSYGIEKRYVVIGDSSIKSVGYNKVEIKHPESVGENILRLDLKNLQGFSLSTSGNYEKFYQQDGKKYSHILSPITGLPYDTGIVSASIISATASADFCDAISTALCLCENVEELTAFINKISSAHPNTYVFAIYSKNDKSVVTNYTGKIKLLDNSFSLVTV